MFDEPTLLVRFKEVAKLQPLTRQARARREANRVRSMNRPYWFAKTPVVEKPRFQISWPVVGSVVGSVVRSVVGSVVWLGGCGFDSRRGGDSSGSIESGPETVQLKPGVRSRRCVLQQLGMRRRKPLPAYASSMMSGPAIAGLLRPRLILPANFATRLFASPSAMRFCFTNWLT